MGRLDPTRSVGGFCTSCTSPTSVSVSGTNFANSYQADSHIRRGKLIIQWQMTSVKFIKINLSVSVKINIKVKKIYTLVQMV